MFCRNCSFRNSDNAAFCKKCGAPLGEDQTDIAAPQGQVFYEPAPVQYQPAPPPPQAPIYQDPYLQPPSQPYYPPPPPPSQPYIPPANPVHYSDPVYTKEPVQTQFPTHVYVSASDADSRKQTYPIPGSVSLLVTIIYILGSLLWLLGGINVVVAAEEQMGVYQSYRMALTDMAIKGSVGFMNYTEQYIPLRESFPKLAEEWLQLLVVAGLAFLFSIPCVRFVPWILLRVAKDDLSIRKFNMSLAIFGGILVAVWLVWRVIDLGSRYGGFRGPLDIVLPFILAIYYWCVWSANERQLDF